MAQFHYHDTLNGAQVLFVFASCPNPSGYRTRSSQFFPQAFTYLRTVAMDGECLPVASERSRRAMAGA